MLESSYKNRRLFDQSTTGFFDFSFAFIGESEEDFADGSLSHSVDFDFLLPFFGESEAFATVFDFLFVFRGDSGTSAVLGSTSVNVAVELPF